MIESLFCRNFIQVIFETASLESSAAWISPKFHNKPVRIFDGNVITIPVFFKLCSQATFTELAQLSQTFRFKNYLNKSSDHNHFTGVPLWRFKSVFGLFCSIKVISYFLLSFSWEKISTWKFSYFFFWYKTTFRQKYATELQAMEFFLEHLL